MISYIENAGSLMGHAFLADRFWDSIPGNNIK